MDGCIWKVAPADRHCEFCAYDPCPERISCPEDRLETYVREMSGIVGEDITSRGRRSDLVWARNIVAYRMRRDGATLCCIGRLLGRDHSTVIHCIESAKMMLDSPRQYRHEIGIWKKFETLINLRYGKTA